VSNPPQPIGSSGGRSSQASAPSQDSGIAPPELSRAVILAIADADGALSIRDIENRVGAILGAVGAEPIEQEVHALEAMALVARPDETIRSYILTEGGLDIANGISILNPT
jgi:hypothetical protein